MTVSETEYEEQATGDPVFEIRDTTVKFGMERGESRVLNDVSIDVERNEILGVVGESGSGKSMFASAMLDAVVEPGTVDGEITYYPREGDPVDVLNLPESKLKRFRWEEVSMVFQGAMSSFNPVRSIETHFVETLSSHDHDMGEGMDRARELLRDLYLEPDRVMESYPHELSGGMQQRVLIALSLLLEPEVIVMDEPTAALDLLMQRSIISLINDLKEKYDLTLVFITHDLPLVADLADRLAVLYAFEFVELGPADEILRHAAHPYTRSLLRATPNLTMPLSEMKPIEGSSPDPVNIPTGCSYHPRCPLSDEQCTEVYPHAYDVNAEHEVHCHYWEESEEAIPVELSGSTTPSAADYASERAGRQSADPVVSMEDVEVHFESDEGMLDRFFSDPQTVRAVDGVSLDVYENDVVVLVGESGCGKTTLGKTAIGLQRPTGGSVNYRGQDIWETKEGTTDGEIPYEEVRRALQIIHQDPGSALNSMRRLRATLQEPLKRWHREKNADDRIDLILAMLEYVGMTPPEAYIDRYPHQLSGGEQQRVALIRALLMNPDLILADEPVSALDVSLRVETMDLLMELQDRFATSYLFVSHDLSNARYIAGMTGGRIAVMYLGTVVEIGTVEQIIDDPRHPYTQSLRWATPELNLSRTAASGTEEAPMRRIDVPDPANPPRGCRYHTRCPKVIPPEGYDFDQEEWNPVMDLKVEVEREGFDRDAIDERLFDGDAGSRPDEAVAAAVRDHFGIPETLSDPAADEVLSTGIGHLVAGDRDRARELFDTEFSTVCERKDPVETLDGSEADRPVACFLEAPEGSGEGTAD